MNYAIFRSEPIYTLKDLAQIGAHNRREKTKYNSNPDIRVEESYRNIDLVPLNCKYVKGFRQLTKEYEKQHNERMKTEREDRKRTYTQMLNKSKNVVADELLFTATHKFFDDMELEDIYDWANTCMEFVYEDLGYKKEQVLHATIHLDEETPHVHCVVVPLIKKYDKRTNTERYTISKKQYIRDKIHLSELQDKYHARLVSKGFDLERGIKGSDNKHIQIKEYKKITRKINHDLNVRNDRLDKAMSNLEYKMKTNKTIPFDKKHVIVEKDTFDSMNNVINEYKKVMELQPKLEKVFKEVDKQSKDYNLLKYDNKNMQNEIDSLKEKNYELQSENNKLKSYVEAILMAIKQFFRKILLHGNEESKELAKDEIKDYYDKKDFNTQDVFHISKGTSKEDELFDYANIPNKYKSNYSPYDDYDNEDSKGNDFEISL